MKKQIQVQQLKATTTATTICTFELLIILFLLLFITGLFFNVIYALLDYFTRKSTMSSVVANPSTATSQSTAAAAGAGTPAGVVSISNCTVTSSTATTGPVATMAIIGPNNSSNVTITSSTSTSSSSSTSSTSSNTMCNNISTPIAPSNIPTGGGSISTTAITAASSAVATPEGEGQPSNTRFKVVKIDQRPGGKSATKGAEDGLVHEHRLMSNGQKSITYKRGRWTVTDFYDAPPVIPAVTHLSNPPSNSNSTPSTPTPNSFLTTGPRLINVTNVITGDTSTVHIGGITTPATIDSNNTVIHSPPVLMDFNSNNGHPLAGFAVKPVPVKTPRITQQQQSECTSDSGSGNSNASNTGPAKAATESHHQHHHHSHHHHSRHYGDRKENAENEPPIQMDSSVSSAIISGPNCNVPPCQNNPPAKTAPGNNSSSLCNNGNSGNNNNTSHMSHAISDHSNAANRNVVLAANSNNQLPEENRSKSSNSSNSSSSPSDSDLTTLVTVVKPHPSKSPKVEGGEISGNGPGGGGGGGGGGGAARPHNVKEESTVNTAASCTEQENNSTQVVTAEKPPLPQRAGQFYVSPVAETTTINNPNSGAGAAVTPSTVTSSSSTAAPDPASGYATPASSIHSVAGACPQSAQSGIPSAYVVTSVAIDNKIEQAMDLVKSHLMFAVKEEVDVLKEKIVGLLERIQLLETENAILRQAQQQQQLHQQLQQQQQSQLHSQSLISNINMHPQSNAAGVAGAQQSSLPTSMIGQANVTDLASAAACSTNETCTSESLTSIPQSNVPSGSSPGTNLVNATTNCATAPTQQQQQTSVPDEPCKK